MRYNALTIAKWFVAWARSDEADLSNLKLQKLLYYAQGHHLARFNRPLFDDAIQAWSHGPVVPAIYRKFKTFGTGDIDLSAIEPFGWAEVDDNTTQFLISVWDSYGGFGAWRLRNMTHGEPPWANNFESDTLHIEIPQSEMQRFFEGRSTRT